MIGSTSRALAPRRIEGASAASDVRRWNHRVLLALRFVVLVSVSCGSLLAQGRVETLGHEVFQMRHQPARHALPLVDPLLSENGSVSFEEETNALVIKDRVSVLEKLGPVLREFDHPVRNVALDFYLLAASRSEDGGSVPTSSAGIPEQLLDELGSLLRLNRYEALGRVRVTAKEGERAEAVIGSGYELSFDVGTILRSRFLRLGDFQVEQERGSVRRQLFHSSLNIVRARPAFITVSRDATSASGLVVAVIWNPVVSGVSPQVPELIPGEDR